MTLTTQRRVGVSDPDVETASEPQDEIVVGRSHEERVVIRCWPKILCTYPVAVLGLLCAVVTWLLPAEAQVADWCGRTFFVVLFLTSLVATFDCRGWHIATVALAVACALLSFWVLSFYLPIFAAFSWIWSRVHLQASVQVYLFFPLAFLILAGCAAIANRFDNWEVTPNELLHNSGPMSDLRRFPAANLKVEKEIPDVFEWFLLGSGRLVIYPSSERQAIVLDNVLRVNRVEERIKHLLGALEVRIDADRV